MHFEGFGLDIKYYKNKQLIDSYSTGFDVVEKWFYAPRYGFLAEFNSDKKEKDIYRRLEIIKDFHLNIIQFYDWMYRHHQTIEKLGFEGIHIDQYGFPKTYYSLINNKRELKDMAKEFGRFIEYTRKELGEEAALKISLLPGFAG